MRVVKTGFFTFFMIKYLMGLKERAVGLAALDYLPKLGYHIKVKDNQNILGSLEQQNNLPLLIYFNHVALDDPLVILNLLHHHLPERNYILPVSETYLEKEAGKLPIYNEAVNVIKLLGFTVPHIIQSYRLRDEKLSEKDRIALTERSSLLSGKFIKLVNSEMESQKHPVIIIAPEGHRSEDGSLQPSESGLGGIVKCMLKQQEAENIFNGLVLPIGLQYEENFTQNINWNPLRQPKVIVAIGNLMTLEEIKDGSLGLAWRRNLKVADSRLYTHFLMLKLSELLPRNMRGIYAEELLELTLAGNFELRPDEDGIVRVFDLSKNQWNLP